MTRLLTLVATCCCLSTSALSATAQDNFQAQFSDALKTLEVGNPAGAAEKLKRLYEATNAPRVRLELARALAAAGDLAQARQLLIAAYEDDPPPEVKASIVNLIDRIDKINGKISFGISLTRVGNPLNQPSTFQFNIGGYELQTKPNKQEKNVFGVIYNLSYEKDISYNLDLRTINSYRDLPNNWGDYFYTDTSFGYRFSLLQSYIRVGVQAYEQLNNSYRLPYIESGLQVDVSERVSLNPRVQIGYFNSLQSAGQSGPNYRAFLPVTYMFDPSKSALIGIGIDRRAVKFKEQAYTAYGVTFASTLNFEYVNVNASAVPRISIFDAVDPFWGVRRVDRSIYVTADISSDHIRYKGFVPAVGFYCNFTSSTVRYYSQRDCGVSTTLRKLF